MKTKAPLLALLAALLAAAALLSCSSAPSDDSGISRERAIEIARQQLEFEAREVEAERAEEGGRPVWRVTFRGEPVGPTHPMGEILIVAVDRETGEVVMVGMS